MGCDRDFLRLPREDWDGGGWTWVGDDVWDEFDEDADDGLLLGFFLLPFTSETIFFSLLSLLEHLPIFDLANQKLLILKPIMFKLIPYLCSCYNTY